MEGITDLEEYKRKKAQQTEQLEQDSSARVSTFDDQGNPIDQTETAERESQKAAVLGMTDKLMIISVLQSGSPGEIKKAEQDAEAHSTQELIDEINNMDTPGMMLKPDFYKAASRILFQRVLKN